jgi:predicted regulator of Ras-like GTPase activity (Roadblock/LC7/MglB family)
VLLISGIVNNTVLERAAKVRSDDVMRKPFAADELLHRIESFLPASSRPAAAAPAVAGAAPAPAAAAPVSTAAVAPPPAAPAPERPVARPERPALVPEPVAAGAAPPAAPPAPELKALLAGVAELAGVSLIALIDREGAVMDVAGGLLPEAELAGALAACLVESTVGVGRALTQGRLQSLILEYDAGVVLLNAVGADAMLAVVLGDPAVLGKVRYHVKKALPDLVRAV